MGILAKNAKVIVVGLVLGMSMLFQCSMMTDTFERIDEFKLRVIGVHVSPRPEVSPGDTVTITAYFAGNAVATISDVMMYHDLVEARDGVAAGDGYPITLLSQPRGFPDSAVFSFVIKKDVFIVRQGMDSIAQSTSDSISRLFMLGKDSVSAMIAGLSDSEKAFLGNIVNKMALPGMLMFTAHSANGSVLTAGASVAGSTVRRSLG